MVKIGGAMKNELEKLVGADVKCDMKDKEYQKYLANRIAEAKKKIKKDKNKIIFDKGNQDGS